MMHEWEKEVPIFPVFLETTLPGSVIAVATGGHAVSRVPWPLGGCCPEARHWGHLRAPLNRGTTAMLVGPSPAVPRSCLRLA